MRHDDRRNRRDFLRTAALGTATLLGGANGWAASGKKRPNILILYSADQGFGDAGCFGGEDVKTPHIDSLAAGGTRLTRWYSNCPVCSPSRTALLTGRYQQRGGVKGNIPAGFDQMGMQPTEITLAEALKEQGYRTGVFGKWHQGSAKGCRPNDQGFDEFYGFINGCIDYYSHIFYWSGLPMHDLWKNDRTVWENGVYFNDIITREANRFIRANQSQPFFMYVPFNAPHYPMHAPPEYYERFAHVKDPHRRIQAAMVSVLDDGVGRILDELKRCELFDDTLIFFISDNGPSTEPRNLLNDSHDLYHGASAGPFRGGKGGLYEGGIRVPAIVSWPGVIPAGQVNDELGVTMDVFPTVIDAVGGTLPDDRPYDGKDVMPTIVQGSESQHKKDDLFWGLGKQRAVRRGDWKLLLNARAEFGKDAAAPVLLHNLKDDPGEKVDLKDKHPKMVTQLKQAIERWEKEVGL